MTTDLRKILHTAAVRLDSYSAIGFTSEGAATRALADQLRTIADAPPTVAELLAALPDPPGGCGPGAHRVEWSHDDMRFRASRYGLAGLIVERCIDGEWRSRTNLNHADLTRPATLVEVTP